MSVNPLYAWAVVVTLALATVALALNVQLALLAAFFVSVGVWAWQRPTLAFYLLIVVAPMLPMFKITQVIGTVTLLKDVLIIVLFLKLWLIPLLQKQLPYRRNILVAPLLALGVWLGVGIVQADSLVLGILRARDSILYILLFLAVLHLPRSRRFYTEAALWFFLSALIVGALGWYQFFAVPDSAVLRFDPARHIWIPRVSSIMAHPSIFGQYIIIVSTLLAALLVAVRRRAALGLMAGLLFLAPLIYLTYSRAVWLGYVGGLGALAAAYVIARVRQATSFRIPWKQTGVVAVVLVLISAGIVQFTSVGVFLRSAVDPTYASNAERLEFLARLIAPLTPAQALFGAGLGDVVVQNFRMADVDSFDIVSGASRSVQLAKDATLVDNQYLKTFIELGLAGILMYAWLYWRVAKGSYLLATNYQLPTAQAIGLWSLGFLAAFLIQAFFIDIWDIFPTNLAFWVVAGLVSREQIVAKG